MKLLIASGIKLYGEALAEMIRGRNSITETRVLSPDEEITPAISEYLPEIILADISAAAGGDFAAAPGYEAVGWKMVIYGVRNCDEDLWICANIGAHGIVMNEGTLDDLIQTVEMASKGMACWSTEVTAKLLRYTAASPAQPKTPHTDSGCGSCGLTPREIEVLNGLSSGLSNKLIANRLGIALPTVKNHVHNILHKLGVRSRSEAIALVSHCQHGKGVTVLDVSTRNLIGRLSEVDGTTELEHEL